MWIKTKIKNIGQNFIKSFKKKSKKQNSVNNEKKIDPQIIFYSFIRILFNLYKPPNMYQFNPKQKKVLCSTCR